MSPLIQAMPDRCGLIVRYWVARAWNSPPLSSPSEVARASSYAKHSLEKSLHHTDNKPLRRMFFGAVSKVAIGLGKLGVSGLAERLYAFSLYPKGSVGRGKI